MSDKQKAVDLLTSWRLDWVKAVHDMWGPFLDGGCMDDWQIDAMQALQRGESLSVKSGHGVGKTGWLGMTIIIWMLFKDGPRVACTAPTSHQLNDALWGEVAKWHKLLPTFLKNELEVKSERIEAKRNPKEYYCVARTARKEQPEAFQGFHAPDMLFIADEASGVENIIFEVGEGSMSTRGAQTILTGNPTRTSGYFFDSHNRMRGSWTTMTVSCETAKMVDPLYIERMEKRYGRDSNVFRVRVLGEFPNVDDDAVISLALCEAAVNRDIDQIPGKIIWGVDVARFGDDSSALAKRQRNRLMGKVKEWKGKDTMQTAGIVVNEYNQAPFDEKPDEILVDSIGIGAGVVDRLRELGLPARGINVAESPSVRDKFLRLRDELWWKAREWLEGLEASIPDDADLIGEWTAPKYEMTSAGKIQVESKADMKKRGVVSPNKADAVNLTFATSEYKGGWGDLKYDSRGIL